MNGSVFSKVLMSVAAVAALAGASVAQAGTSVYLALGVPAVVAAPVQVAHPVYERERGHDGYWREREWRGDHRRELRRACRAERWDPRVRYMPGERVWRRGAVYVATPVSARVWNENSPPEWTPNYWAPVNCAPREWQAREWRRGDWR